MDAYMNSDDRKDKTSKPAAAETWDVLDVLLLLTRNRRLIVIVTSAAFGAGLLLALVTTPKFTAKAVILPPQQQTSSSALLNQLGSLSVLGGGAAALGLKSPADLYIGMLQSRTISDALIEKFHLHDGSGKKRLESIRVALKAQTEIETGKDGLIKIAVTDPDPKRASDLANAYVEQLYTMNSNLAIAEAAQRRAFFDQQLDSERKALTSAEDDLRATQQRTGIIQPTGQAQMIIQNISQLRAQIANREVSLRSTQSFASDENPDVIRLTKEISTMRRQLSKLENDQQHQVQPGDISLPAGRIAEDTLEYARKYREVKYHDALFDLLSRQFEAARIDEAKSAPIIQVIDHAIPPDTKSSPRRFLIVFGFFVFGFFASLVISVGTHALEKAKKIPEQAAKLEELRSQVRRV
jgi:tyrosine-protein kinase Etk/Wzc